MSEPRFAFRMTYWKNLETYFQHGFIAAKNHPEHLPAYQTSYVNIVNRRGTQEFRTPNGKLINDYVPFYFSPITAMSFTIHKRNVDLISPEGTVSMKAMGEDLAFIVTSPLLLQEQSVPFYFSDIACNTSGLPVSFDDNLDNLESHINWPLFDDTPRKGIISEIGYKGVCQFFRDFDSPPKWQNRSKARMAEFLVEGKYDMKFSTCVVVNSREKAVEVEKWISQASLCVPVYVKTGCYFQ